MAHQARWIHIDKFIEPGPLRLEGLLESPHALATDIEAIVGAVWVDSETKFEAVEDVMRRLHSYPDTTYAHRSRKRIAFVCCLTRIKIKARLAKR